MNEIRKTIFEPCGLSLSNLIIEPESKEYAAHEFDLNDLHVKYRAAKITPTKIGQFVTLWKRLGKGPIQPFEVSDLDLVIISTRAPGHFGWFAFSKSVLVEKGILSTDHTPGKLAIRVYPPWDKAENKQAIRTQKWQLLYFFDKPEAFKAWLNQT